MVLRPGWSIHTAFMRFPIDAVFLDADQVVIKIEHEVGQWRTVSCRGAREVVELSAGECRRRGLEVGDRVAWASRSAADARSRPSGRSVRRRGRRAARSRARREQRSALPAARPLPARRPRLRGRGADVTRAAAGSHSRADASTSPSSTAPTRSPKRSAPPTQTRARRPEVPVVIAADTGGKSPSGMRVFDRWNETEELLQDVERLLSERLAGAAPFGRG